MKFIWVICRFSIDFFAFESVDWSLVEMFGDANTKTLKQFMRNLTKKLNIFLANLLYTRRFRTIFISAIFFFLLSQERNSSWAFTANGCSLDVLFGSTLQTEFIHVCASPSSNFNSFFACSRRCKRQTKHIPILVNTILLWNNREGKNGQRIDKKTLTKRWSLCASSSVHSGNDSYKWTLKNHCFHLPVKNYLLRRIRRHTTFRNFPLFCISMTRRAKTWLSIQIAV